jgi:ubiquinone biosynthesis protein
MVHRRQLPAFDWLLELLDDIALRTATGFGEDFLLFRKSWLSLSGIIGDLVEDPSPDRRLLGVALQRFIGELPARPFTLPDSPNFSTHVSNVDILRLWISPWLVSLRYWNRQLKLAAGTV